MSSTYNVVALKPNPPALQAGRPKVTYPEPLTRMTAAFRALLEAPESPVELAFIRLTLSDVTSRGLTGSITWSLDEVCQTIVIRQWPSSRVLDMVPFPVGRLSNRSRALRFAALIGDETATIGIADDPDPIMIDETGRRIGSRPGVFP